MVEGKWHKDVREELIRELQKQKRRVYSSHTDISKLELFKEKPESQNCLSDTDIVVFDSEKKRIEKIIEIESTINPKKIIGIVLATHFCTLCRIKEKDYPLKSVLLDIIYRKSKEKSKIPQKLKVIENSLKEIIRKTDGCLLDFKLKEYK